MNRDLQTYKANLQDTTLDNSTIDRCMLQYSLKMSKSKTGRIKRGYAPPQKYKHLKYVPDSLASNLLLVIVGLNPGIATSKAGHAFAGPNNVFWWLLRESGVVPSTTPLKPQDDQSLPAKWSVGLTNLCHRPTAEQSELSKQEMIDAVQELQAKIQKLKPKVVCISGKGIYEAIWRAKYSKNLPKDIFKFGFQPEDQRFGRVDDWPGSRLFVAPSTSGRVVAYSRQQRLEIWKELGRWISEQRRENLRN